MTHLLVTSAADVEFASNKFVESLNPETLNLAATRVSIFSVIEMNIFSQVHRSIESLSFDLTLIDLCYPSFIGVPILVRDLIAIMNRIGGGNLQHDAFLLAPCKQCPQAYVVFAF
ncbi:hypothetical protein LIPSTDRAFT_5761 [Lipomyces starkeyi NRRL Y-11557]|uniref:Uncharacterized protein n=1 Tax=Lipomyces starkeyi NRRL Y-11557 TaxID=675824 RepID=A0A1E3PZR9_LIPST|nr:hypothetical protein LIPSTDRAFT_5761 [Lipomyces starkeyi NRRL Y-11557]